MILYAIIACAILIAINSLFSPSRAANAPKEASYSEFIQMVNDNKVDDVILDTTSGEIQFTTGNGDNKESWTCTQFPGDDTLVQRLEDHGVTYSAVTQSSDDSFIAHFLHVAELCASHWSSSACSWWLNRRLKKAMGGDGPSMTFGGGMGGMGGWVNQAPKLLTAKRLA